MHQHVVCIVMIRCESTNIQKKQIQNRFVRHPQLTYLICRKMLLHTVIESKVDHIEDTAAHHRRTEAPVDTSKSQAISADDLSGHHPGGGRFG